MTLIQCPKCQHTISSVASCCPHCGAQTQYRFVQGQGGALTECRRCSRKVLSGAMVCPYCGVRRPGRRTPYIVAVLVVLLAAPIGLFALVYSRAPQTALLVQPPAAAPGPKEAPAPPVRSLELAQRAGASVAAGASALAPATALPAASGESSRDSAQSAPGGTVMKWALDWANVREGRALGTPVVHVLHPGEQVLVGDRQAGWWAVYQESRVLGYVAGSVLGDQPPAPVVPDSVRGLSG